MHLYNAWLPSPVAELTAKEKDAFAHVVSTVTNAWRPDDEDSAYGTLKWISVLDSFIKAKSEIALEDVKALVEVGLRLFLQSQYNLYIQVRWGNLLVRLLKKYGKKLDLTIQWRPLYERLLQTHFSRHPGAEGLRLRQRHLETLTSLIRCCRQFFPSGSLTEIWLEFRPFMENLWHNSSLEGAGFVQLFLPTNADNLDSFTNDWVADMLNLWVGMPNCQFWDFQWAAVVARCIKHCTAIDWECFLPVLFTQYLNMFEVPVAKTNAAYPFPRDVPRSTSNVFCSNKLVTPAKDIAKSIVYLLKPCGSAQTYFENMVSLLEQYYHPSNGGRWTYSLERFLRYLVYFFQKRLAQEQRNREVGASTVQHFLGSLEREAFVKVVLKIIERSQYSKNESLAGTAAAAASLLSYVEPSLVLPFIVSRFHIAFDTITATHQLKSAVTTVALSARALLLASARAPHMESNNSDCISSPADYANVLTFSMYNTLLGMDANDPPKTLATMQLFGSLFSSLAELVDKEYGRMVMLDINFSDWLDEFLCRLFPLLLHLEPNTHLNEGLHSAPYSGTFLVEEGPFYFCMLEILLGKLTRPLYHQALKKICKFVHSHVLPGAVAEIGLLCSATLYANPEEAVVPLLHPLIASVISSLKESPSTGFGGSQRLAASFVAKVSLSPALEASVAYHLNVLSVAINYGGPSLLQYKDEMKEAISASFDAPSWKVNEAGNHLLRSLIGSLVLYYPLDQYKCHLSYPGIDGLEEWISTKGEHNPEVIAGPKWHIPSNGEIAYANDLLDIHLRSALNELRRICQTKNHLDPGYEKEHLKVILLRIDASLQGTRSCLPDFQPLLRNGKPENQKYVGSFIVGAAGISVGSAKMREDTAETIDIACKYVLEQRSDDSILLILLTRILDALGNYGSLEYEEWSSHKQAWRVDTTAIKEPPSNFITGYHAQGKRRPRWALIDQSYMHNTWRASQSGYHQFLLDGNISLPLHITLLMNNLLQLSMHNYDAVRLFAGKCLIKMLKRFPSLIKECMPTLIASLRDPGTPEHAALGACTILASRIVMRHIMKDWNAFASFILAILGSSHHESFKAQKSITELFVAFNVQYAGVPRSTLSFSEETFEGSEYMELISQSISLSSDMHSTHWRYNLMAHRMLLLLALPLEGNFSFASKTRDEIAGHFLVNLKSQVPLVRVLSAAALVLLLQASPYKNSNSESSSHSGCSNAFVGSSLESALNPIIQEEGFVNDMLNSLSHDHIFSDAHGTSGRGSHAMATFQTITDKSITGWFQAFHTSWPRTRNWNALLNGDAFLSSFAKLFKRLVQECGLTVLQALHSPLEELLIATEERGKQCVASEVLAGILHSDVNCVLEAWDGWLGTVVRKVLLQSTVETSPEWAACVRFAVTGKGSDGKTIPRARQKILQCLAEPLPSTVATNLVAKRFTLLCAALLEIFPSCMPAAEINFQENLLPEVLDCMNHSAAQVRESIGALLCVLCSNIRLSSSFGAESSNQMKSFDWNVLLAERASLCANKIQTTGQSTVFDRQLMPSDDNNGKDNNEQQEHIKWMETALHFIISSLRSGRASALMDVIISLLYPLISLQETSHKDLSSLARAAFELLKWQIFPQPQVSTAVTVLVSAANDTNWHTRVGMLIFLQSFMYRHTFLLSSSETHCMWDKVQQLLTDNQVEVREIAATVLAGLMRGGNSKLVDTFRESSFNKALSLDKRSKTRLSKYSPSLASTHGVVLALAACILSVPYDMPSWLPDTVTLLARFIGEPLPIKTTVMKTIAEFRRTHADTWAIQKDCFTEEQLEVLADTSSSSSYFA